MTDKAPAAAEAKKQEPVSSLEGEDEFEEFAAEVPEELEASKEEEGKELWQADWDDADTSEDFQAKLKQELDRDMKD
ncbi:hypothetical protein OEZ85_010864 [Tetradesmus obliquus]|uniref:26S proteasome complex subunit SEM1 n=1 Tax=Tetradesmus obliquus TaxID=3088 RepID=A0ABY8TP85_TETOB|nr:hypothetical protein OEZ85_010864 [Tetradesmus obliquus]